jgi:7-carboxy-7-deazaguanine synthase
LSTFEIVNKVLSVSYRGESKDAVHSNLVVLTGGEPLRQNVVPLIRMLAGKGYTTQIETAGTLYVEDLYGLSGQLTKFGRPACEIVLSPKTPKVNEDIRLLADAWKYILSTDNVGPDGLPLGVARPVHPNIFPPVGSENGNTFEIVPRDRVYVQPMDEGDPARNDRNTRAAVASCRTFGYTLSLQLHKLLGLP